MTVHDDFQSFGHAPLARSGSTSTAAEGKSALDPAKLLCKAQHVQHLTACMIGRPENDLFGLTELVDSLVADLKRLRR